MEVFENALQTRYLSYSCGRGFFSNTEKNLRFRKYWDTGGRGLSLNELRPKKRNPLDELINIPTMAEERSMIQISRSGPKIRASRQAQSAESAPKFTAQATIHCVFKFDDLPQKSIIGMLSLRPTPSIR